MGVVGVVDVDGSVMRWRRRASPGAARSSFGAVHLDVTRHDARRAAEVENDEKEGKKGQKRAGDVQFRQVLGGVVRRRRGGKDPRVAMSSSGFLRIVDWVANLPLRKLAPISPQNVPRILQGTILIGSAFPRYDSNADGAYKRAELSKRMSRKMSFVSSLSTLQQVCKKMKNISQS